MASTFWRVEEATGQGCYIVLPGLFETRGAAEQAIANERSNQGMRAALYRTGRWNGAERVEPQPAEE